MKINQTRVLIANHGEIARRIQASCHKRKISTVALYTQEEVGAAYISAAHQVYKLAGSGAQAYFNQEEILNIAQKSGAHAIHPGYGFLSENDVFAQRVIDAGLIWIGPNPRAIELMGNKVVARRLAFDNHIPVIPGASFQLSEQGAIKAHEYATSIGYPVLIKNPLSGGGKGMRVVQESSFFIEQWNNVIAEAALQGLDSPLLVEKCIQKGRHVEVQVLGDGKNYLHAYERECSLQRRHQKIIEEAPCQFISDQVRSAMHDAALVLARAVEYDSVGTVEFLVADQQFYFLEMNTRLQVEHSVTEMVTGVDLVDEQLQIAFNKKLSYHQEELVLRGHAVECRVYAEDPCNNFQPSSGTISALSFPHLPNVRIDQDMYLGGEVSPFFDPMIAKVTSWGRDRSIAFETAYYALSEIVIGGITHNIPLLKALLIDDTVLVGDIHTELLKDPLFFDAVKKNYPENVYKRALAVCASFVLQDKENERRLSISEAQGARHFAWRQQLWA